MLRSIAQCQKRDGRVVGVRSEYRSVDDAVAGDPPFETSISTTKWILCLYIPSTNQCHAASPVWRLQHREERSQLVTSPKHHPGRPRKKQASFHSDSAHEEGSLER